MGGALARRMPDVHVEVGANATVKYGSVDGKNLAVRVIVRQTSSH